jgi:large repetitive protein
MVLRSRASLAILFAALSFLLLPACVLAQSTYDYNVYVDSDANPATGCSEGLVNGAEVRLHVTASGGLTPQVVQVARARCSGATFGAESTIGGNYAVGTNNGLAGSDVIELSDSLSQLASQGSPSLIFSIVATSAAGQDSLLTSNGAPDGGPIALGLDILPIPLLGIPALVLMALLVGLIGARMARRRTLWRVVALLSLLSGVALAANFVVDGQVGDWNGLSPLATDPAGDATSGESSIDLRAFYAAIENDRVFMRVDVTNLQNNAPVAVASSVTTLEDQAVTVTLTGTDTENDPLTFAIVSSPTLGSLGAIVPTGPQSATVLYTPAADANGSDGFSFTVNDGQATSAAAAVSLTITPVNDVPSFSGGADQTVNEDAGAQTVSPWATAISAGPANESGQLLDFIVSNDNNALFSAQPAISASGVLSFTPAANANGSATVTVSLHDNGGTANGGVDTSPAQTFTITVNSVNDAPVFTKGPDQTVLESAPAQTINPWATAISAGPPDEAGQTLAFTVGNDNNALFSAQPAVSPTGVLTYALVPGANGVALVTLSLADDGGTANGGVDTSPAQTFTITVTAINDAPSFSAGPNQSVLEDAGPQTVDPWATAISAGPPNESGQVVNFNVTGNTNPALFSAGPAVSSTGVLSYTPAADANGVATITLVAMDDGGTANGGVDTSPPQTFTITVTSVNDIPAIDLNGPAAGTDFAATYTEGNPALAIVDAAALTVTDVDNVNLASATVTITNLLDGTSEILAANTAGTSILAGYAAGVLSLSGSDTVANYQTVLRSVTYINSSSAPNETARSVSFVANDGTDSSNIATSTVTVVGVNSIPSFTGGAPVVINEDAGAQTIPNWATAINDNDGGLQTLNFTLTPSSGALTFAAAPAISPTGTLTFTATANVSGSATFNVVLVDSGSNNNTSAAQTLTITVNPVNDAPSFTKGADQTVLEDAGAQSVPAWATAISPGPADESGQSVSFNITGNTNPTLFSTPPSVSSTGTLSYTPAANAFGSATISLNLMDSGGTVNGGVDTSATQTFVINVTSVNDAPAFVKGADQATDDNLGPQTVNPWATGIVAGPANESGQTVSFVIDSNSAPSIFTAGPSISSTGVLTYTPATVATTTTATITLHAMDDGGTANGGVNVSPSQSFTIAISHANTAPTLTNPTISYATPGNTQLHVAGATVAGLVSVSDAASALTKSIPTDPDGPSPPSVVPATGTSTNSGNYSIASDGSFTYVPPAGFAGIDSFTFQVTDGNLPTPGIAVGTVNVTVGPTVWYVSNLNDANNPVGGDGRSSDAFDSLAGAQAASVAGDIIFVFRGNTGATALAGGIVLKDGQRLWGEGYGLTVAPFGTLVASGLQPRINAAAADAVSVPATAGNRVGVEIRGLDLQGNQNAIDVTAAGANNVGVTINGNTISGATAEGIDVNFGSTGTEQVAIQSNNVTATGTGIDVTRTLGTGVITAFNDNTISGNTGGSGIAINDVQFDATPGLPIQTVNGGNTAIGVSGNGTGTNGLLLSNVTGDLSFTDLDIFNEAGTGLRVLSTGALNAAAGTGFRVAVSAGVGTLNSTGGPALDVNSASISLPLGNVQSTNSPTTGVSLVSAFGVGGAAFSAVSGSITDPAGASGTAFQVGAGSGSISFPGTITSTSGNAVTVNGRTGDLVSFSGSITDSGSGISLTSNTGATIAFSGPLSLSTGANIAFNATGGGTVTASNTTSTATTTTATAVNVVSTTIGAAGLNFRSVSAGTGVSGPVNGIVLNTTGTLGGLVVSGNGSAGTGGTIQNTTGTGVLLTSTSGVSLSWMNIQNSADDGINGASVGGISILNSNVINNGNSTTDEGIELINPSGAIVLTGVIAAGNAHNNVAIDDADNTGGNSTLTVTGSSFATNSPADGNHGMLMQIRGTAVLGTSSISASTFSSNRSIGLQVTGGDTATISDLTVTGNTFNTTTGQVQQIAMDLSKAQTSSMTVKVLGNTITGQNSHAMNFFTAAGAGTTGIYNARIENNFVGVAATVGSGSLIGNCMRININGDADATVLVNNNVLRQCPNGRGIEAVGRNGTGGLDITITNNDVNPNDTSGFPLASIFVQSNAVSIGNTVRSNINTNTVPAGSTFDLLPTYIAVVETGASVSELVDIPPASASCTAQLTSANTGSASASAGCALIPGPISTPP